jgi:hypothetical protein
MFVKVLKDGKYNNQEGRARQCVVGEVFETADWYAFKLIQNGFCQDLVNVLPETKQVEPPAPVVVEPVAVELPAETLAPVVTEPVSSNVPDMKKTGSKTGKKK